MENIIQATDVLSTMNVIPYLFCFSITHRSIQQSLHTLSDIINKKICIAINESYSQDWHFNSAYSDIPPYSFSFPIDLALLLLCTN